MGSLPERITIHRDFMFSFLRPTRNDFLFANSYAHITSVPRKHKICIARWHTTLFLGKLPTFFWNFRVFFFFFTTLPLEVVKHDICSIPPYFSYYFLQFQSVFTTVTATSTFGSSVEKTVYMFLFLHNESFQNISSAWLGHSS